jgi:hypothetical protein
LAVFDDLYQALLTDESFEWEISSDNITVAALGIEVTGIAYPAKKVTLKGFNGLKGGVTIKSFDLPSNDEAGGIHLTLEADTVNVRSSSFHWSDTVSHCY